MYNEKLFKAAIKEARKRIDAENEPMSIYVQDTDPPVYYVRPEGSKPENTRHIYTEFPQ